MSRGLPEFYESPLDFTLQDSPLANPVVIHEEATGKPIEDLDGTIHEA
jgi:hypothetical protein